MDGLSTKLRRIMRKHKVSKVKLLMALIVLGIGAGVVFDLKESNGDYGPH
jgi:hypothetical protein